MKNLYLGSLIVGKNWNILLLANRWAYNQGGLQQMWMMGAYNKHYTVYDVCLNSLLKTTSFHLT